MFTHTSKRCFYSLLSSFCLTHILHSKLSRRFCLFYPNPITCTTSVATLFCLNLLLFFILTDSHAAAQVLFSKYKSGCDITAQTFQWLPISLMNKMHVLWPPTHSFSGPHQLFSSPFSTSAPLAHSSQGLWCNCSLWPSALSPDSSPVQPLSSGLCSIALHCLFLGGSSCRTSLLSFSHPLLCFHSYHRWLLDMYILFIVLFLLMRCRVHGNEEFFYICLN